MSQSYTVPMELDHNVVLLQKLDWIEATYKMPAPADCENPYSAKLKWKIDKINELIVSTAIWFHDGKLSQVDFTLHMNILTNDLCNYCNDLNEHENELEFLSE